MVRLLHTIATADPAHLLNVGLAYGVPAIIGLWLLRSFMKKHDRLPIADDLADGWSAAGRQQHKEGRIPGDW